MNYHNLLCRPGIVAAILLAASPGCGAQPAVLDVPDGAPPGFPADRYSSAQAGETIFEVDPARSLVQVYVYRGGALARLGHDHVVASRDVAGFLRRVRLEDGTIRFEGDMYTSLAAMSVDEAPLRAEAGFTTEPSEKDRAGTRSNMLKSLEAATFPFARVSISTAPVAAEKLTDSIPAEVTLVLHGVTKTFSVTVQVQTEQEALLATGSFELAQTDYDIKPFSVMGGALAVKDVLNIGFELHALEAASDLD